MRKSQLLIILALLSVLFTINQLFTSDSSLRRYLGGLPWYGWASIALFLVLVGIGFALRDAARARQLLEEPVEKDIRPDDQRIQLSKDLLEKYDPAGPDYPHPVIISDRCIGCEACVEACPHDVLAMVKNIAVPNNREQCMEDTSCQVACPVNPKACIVVNTTKIIKPRPVPVRDERFMTNVPGCYLIGAVSGTPMIKNAANEGADVINYIDAELRTLALEPKTEYEVAIIGIGPGGLSAAVTAKLLGLKYIAIEKNVTLATIVAYPKNKYLFFKPESMESRGAIPTQGDGDQRERLLDSWLDTMNQHGVVINEREECKAVKRASDGDYFIIETKKATGHGLTYLARRVVLALGDRGAPMKLRVPGEEIKIRSNGGSREKVMYELSNPDEFKKQKIIIVGGGNAAVEAAVDLVARRGEDKMEFRSSDEINEVTLVVRTDFKNDVKFLNKQQIYRCIDEGKVKVHFGTVIKEIRENEVIVAEARTKEEKGVIRNDYVLAMIGGGPPTDFLESIGVSIPKS